MTWGVLATASWLLVRQLCFRPLCLWNASRGLGLKLGEGLVGRRDPPGCAGTLCNVHRVIVAAAAADADRDLLRTSVVEMIMGALLVLHCNVPELIRVALQLRMVCWSRM